MKLMDNYEKHPVRQPTKISIYDCGCVSTRPKDPSVKSYGTRWRAYITRLAVKLKCRDCGRVHTFELKKEGVQMIKFGDKNSEEEYE